MCLLSVGLDTLGLLLRVWLWISVPMAVIILCVGTWMNYVRHARSKGGLRMAVEGMGGEPFIGRDDVVGEGGETFGEAESGDAETIAEGESGDRRTIAEGESGDASDREELTATGNERIYQGILWMKEKYEQYREQADHRYELLREEYGRSEQRYQGLLATLEQDKNRALGMVTDDRIEELEAQLRVERLKVGELVMKLQANSELILRIYRELESIPDLGK
jgi:hypothetical protein